MNKYMKDSKSLPMLSANYVKTPCKVFFSVFLPQTQTYNFLCPSVSLFIPSVFWLGALLWISHSIIFRDIFIVRGA